MCTTEKVVILIAVNIEGRAVVILIKAMETRGGGWAGVGVRVGGKILSAWRVRMLSSPPIIEQSSIARD